MSAFYDSQGNSYILNQEIGRGGEGTVFFCPDDLSLVAKIYHAPVDAEKAEKLRWMAQNKNDRLLKVAAWIVDTLHDAPGGKTVGFLMPNVKAKEIHELYSLKSRRVYFPEATWQFLLHTAANVARAFYLLHKNDHIMGDVNHGNCVVLADGTVKLIDCDSYSIKTDKMRYACDVGVATHLAPELQGLDLGEVERKKTHDNFGLAVIIFQLLFLGRHPFAGNYLGAEDKSLEDCIREQRFAYGNQAFTNVKQPPGTLSLAQLPLRLATMFNRAFFTEERPEPREWIEALEDLSNSLKQCSVHIGHHYFNELSACPWCEIETKTGLMLFPFVSSGKDSSENGFNIFTVENLLASLDIPQNLPAKPLKPAIIQAPSAEVQSLRAARQARFFVVAVLQFFIVLVLTVIAGAGTGFIFGLIVMFGFFVIFQNSDKDKRRELEAQRHNARLEWNDLEDDWDKNNKAEELNADVALVRTKLAEHQALQQQSRNKMNFLQKARFQYQLDLYLASHHLADAKILGFEKKHFNFLHHFGIVSAADIEANRLSSIPPIEGDAKAKVLEWRKNLERNFQFDPDTELPEADKNRFALQFAEKRGRIEKEIERLLVSLRSGSMSLQIRQKQMFAKSETLAQKLLQAESNAAAVGSNALMIIVLFFISGLIPLFGAAFNRNPYQSVTNYPTQRRPVNSPGFSANTATVTNNTNTAVYMVDDNLTAEQIERMTVSEREKYAENLFIDANRLIGTKNKDAEKKLRLAVKLDGRKAKILNSLGTVLYEQKKYSESLVYLKQSLEINSDNENTKLMIGANYLKLRKFNDAIRILNEVRIKNPKSFEANFNLGQANKELKYYSIASGYFLKATEINPNDADAHYELGFCFYKEGNEKSADDQHQILLDLDEEKAEKLAQVTGMRISPRVVRGVGNGQGFGSGNGSGNGSGQGFGNGIGR